jgi:hypothetical protein
MLLQPEDCFILGIIRGVHWYTGHHGADAAEQATACSESADDLHIPDRAGFSAGWREGIRMLEQHPWNACSLCHRERPRSLLHKMGEAYLCLACEQEQKEIERQIDEHEARHS